MSQAQALFDTPAPPDTTRKIFAIREHNGQERRRYHGHTAPDDADLHLYDHRTGEHHTCPKREVMPDEWDIHVMAQEAASMTGLPYEAIIRELREKLTLLTSSSGLLGPDPSETSDGRRARTTR